MGNKEIVEKAITKAIKNGWNPIDDMGEVDRFKVYRADNDWKGIWIEFLTKIGDGGQLDIVRMLFTHGFSKAFWGGEDKVRTCWACDGSIDMDGWSKHLQQMVLEKEPLKYLEKFLDKE